MPLYEYHCEDCGENFEVIQKFSDSPLTVCKNCGGKVERLLSAPAIQFKGSGWYVTDYAHKNGKAAATEPKESAKSTESEGGAEKKDAAKSKEKSDSTTKTD